MKLYKELPDMEDSNKEDSRNMMFHFSQWVSDINKLITSHREQDAVRFEAITQKQDKQNEMLHELKFEILTKNAKDKEELKERMALIELTSKEEVSKLKVKIAAWSGAVATVFGFLGSWVRDLIHP